MLGTLVLLALAPALQAADSVTITAAPAQIGEGVHVVASVETRNAVVFTVGGAKLRDFEQKIVDTRSFDARLVAGAGGEGVAAVRFDYGECRSVLTDPSGDSSERLPVDRRRYVAERAPGDAAASGALPGALKVQELHVLSGQNGANGATGPNGPKSEMLDVDEGVAAQVARDAGELLLGGRFAPFLAGRPLAIGQPLDVPPEVARALLAGVLDGGTVKSFTLTPKTPDADGDVPFAAALAVAMTQGDDLPVASTFELAGTIVLGRAHGRLVELDLAGPIRFGGSKEEGGTKIEVTGTGTLTWKYRCDPLATR